VLSSGAVGKENIRYDGCRCMLIGCYERVAQAVSFHVFYVKMMVVRLPSAGL
jgi:hypothetical protein